MSPQDELSLLLRPAGGGVYVVSTGRAEQLAVQRKLYGVEGEAEIEGRFKAALKKIPNARVVILGIPSDVGAGYVRGANLGPQAIRARLLEDEPDLSKQEDVVDIGDVLVVPQLLHDEMLSEDQKRRSRAATYPDVPGRDRLPVSPLSRAERALDLVFQLNPNIKPLVFGGDHSCAWPVVSAISRVRKQGTWGIVQIDAHTDLLDERLGVRYCFATWSAHANELVGRNGRLVQVGIRATRHDRGHWEKTRAVRQFWAEECVRDPRASIDAVVEHVKRTKVESIYFSNDIDGTDARFASATGTPEPNGLMPDFVEGLIERLGKEVTLVGGDVMEVAPPLAKDGDVTLSTASRYARATLKALR